MKKINNYNNINTSKILKDIKKPIKNKPDKICKKPFLMKLNKVNKDKDEGFINSQSTRDQKISVDTKLNKGNIDPWLDHVNFNECESSINKSEKKTYLSLTKLSNTLNKSITKSVKQKTQIDSKTSYFLNQHLGESYYSLEDHDNKSPLDQTVLSPLKEIFSCEDRSLTTECILPDTLDLSKEQIKIKVHRKISSIKKTAQVGMSNNKFSLNISFMNDSHILKEDKTAKVDRCLLPEFCTEESKELDDINEFSGSHKIEIYQMKIHSNNIKSGDDVLNLKKLFRNIFNKSDFIYDVIKFNIRKTI
jgi:hypothetical protein